MAVIIGGVGDDPWPDNFIVADDEDNYIFGDAFSTGNPDGVWAVGGYLNREAGHDIVIGGSAQDNVLGDAWVITSRGVGGADRLHGFRGADNLFGDSFSMIGKSQGGGDQLFGGWGHDNLFGDAFELHHQSQGANDNLFGDLGRDNLFGDAYEMWDRAWGSADQLFGGQGDDRLFGDSYTMADQARGGRDKLNGGDGHDSLFGDAYEMSGRAFGQNDKLEGGAGRDSLFGDAFEAGIGARAVDVRGGDDVLIGGSGNDALWGDFANVDGKVSTGRDIFMFHQGSGQDLILDFEVGKDLIDIRDYGFAGFADLTLVDNGSSAVAVLLDPSGHNQILVQNLVQSPLELTARDFLVA
jgi:Ca2+-binding RTX toxin-like protein